eukprot:504999-Amphidinium_carterae.1
MPPSGSAPGKRFLTMRKYVTFLSPLLGSAPAKLFVEISKALTACKARMPLSGSAPAKLFCFAPRLRTSLVTCPTLLGSNTPTTLWTH